MKEWEQERGVEGGRGREGGGGREGGRGGGRDELGCKREGGMEEGMEGERR